MTLNPERVKQWAAALENVGRLTPKNPAQMTLGCTGRYMRDSLFGKAARLLGIANTYDMEEIHDWLYGHDRLQEGDLRPAYRRWVGDP